jgi:hypothetical protein
VGRLQRQSIWSLLTFGFAVPFFLWNCLMGFVIYVQHTHPRVAWYERRDEWSANAGYATTTVHIKLMRPLDGLIHYILEHGAHHVNMGIPLYRLKEAQARLTATLDERLNSEVFTWRYYWNTVRAASCTTSRSMCGRTSTAASPRSRWFSPARRGAPGPARSRSARGELVARRASYLGSAKDISAACPMCTSTKSARPSNVSSSDLAAAPKSRAITSVFSNKPCT